MVRGTTTPVEVSLEDVEDTSPANPARRAPRTVPGKVLGKVLGKFGKGGIGRDTAWALGIEVLMLAVSVLSFALLGSGLGANGYGQYVAVFAITGMFGTLSGAGTGLTLIHHALREREPLDQVVRSTLSFGVISGLVTGLIALPVVLAVVDSVSLATAATFVAAELLVTPVGVVAADILRVTRGFGAASILRVISLSIRVTILVVLFAVDRLTLSVLGPTILVSSITTSTLSYLYACRVAGFSPRTGLPTVRHARTAGLYAVGLTALAVQNDGDKAVLAAHATGPEAGIYAAAYKIVQFGLVPMNSLMTSSHQRFLDHDEHAEGQHTRRTMRYSAVAAVYGTAFGLATLIGAPLLARMLGDEYRDAGDTIRLLAPMVLARSVSVFALNGLLGLGRNGVRTTLLIASAVLSFGMYLALIPSMGSTGAILGTLVSEGLVALVAWVLLIRFQRGHDAGVRAKREVAA